MEIKELLKNATVRELMDELKTRMDVFHFEVDPDEPFGSHLLHPSEVFVYVIDRDIPYGDYGRL